MEPNEQQNEEPTGGTTPERSTKSGLTPSESPNNSFAEGAGEENTGFDSPAIASETLSNEEYLDLESTRNRASTTGETAEGIEPGDQAHEAE
jgi:hypothetical protein